MNYRHHFHAGNFADVMKHVLLVQLIVALQKKEKGFLYLDTHAGRGSYDLSEAAKGDSRVRDPEWPDGIGRLWAMTEPPSPILEYVDLVRRFDHDRGNRDALPRFYPGSPWVARLLARPQDRIALCEKHPAEYLALAEEFRFSPRTTVQEMDGYVSLRAMLPPLERRALVLIDPAYEVQDEFAQLVAALEAGLARLPSAVFALWYPLTERARVDRFQDELAALALPPTLLVEMTIGNEQAGLKMRGCGLVVLNPPWQFDGVARIVVTELAAKLAQSSGAAGSIRWLVPER
ncbi:MAG: 23S rRNA (adenine(2030)-N(6))-methyltransferase RlmJ [Opitutus sp.]